jgi:tetratricopeptide (TPR) repeat protein
MTAEEMFGILKGEFPNSEYTRRATAEKALWEGDTAQGLQILEKLPQKSENDWYTLASVYMAQKKGDKARRAIDSIPDIAAWKDARQQLAASLAFYEGRFQESYAQWKRIADTTFFTQYNLALAAYHANQYAEAVRVGEKLAANATGGNRSNLCRLIGNASFKLKDWKKARSWYLQLSGLQSQDAVVQYNLAVASYNLGQMEDAWKYYQAARQLDPSLSNPDIEKRHAAQTGQAPGSAALSDSTDIWYNQAVDLQAADNDSGASILYLKILERDSAYVKAWNNLGAIHSKHGEIDDAINCYTKSIARRHDLPEAYANLVNLYIALEEFEKAHYWLFKGKFHNPDSPLLQEMETALTDAKRAVNGRVKE